MNDEDGRHARYQDVATRMVASVVMNAVKRDMIKCIESCAYTGTEVRPSSG